MKLNPSTRVTSESFAFSIKKEKETLVLGEDRTHMHITLDLFIYNFIVFEWILNTHVTYNTIAVLLCQ